MGMGNMYSRGGRTSPPPAKTHIYVAGPMRGFPEFNFPAFFAAEARLKALGFTVGNPARWDEEAGETAKDGFSEGDIEKAAQAGFSLRQALGRDMEYLTSKADAIYMLNGWEKSAGATAEHALAKALGLAIYYEGTIPYADDSVLSEPSNETKGAENGYAYS